MSSLLSSLTYNDERTENNMRTHSTSGSFLLDMFFQMGGARRMEPNQLVAMLSRAYHEDPLIALKLVFHNRNIRGGQGERESFRIFLRYLAERHPEALLRNLHLVPLYGRWDDLFAVFGTVLQYDAMVLIGSALMSGNGLAAKWMPREGKRGFKEFALPLIKEMGIDRATWRRLMVANTHVVEQQMSAGEWATIEYEHVPSKAMLKYRKAFARHDQTRYQMYLNAVEAGEQKIKAGALYPHELVRPILSRSATGSELRQIELQWDALPDYVGDGLRFLPVSDVSGSMSQYGPEPLLVSISLGIYLSQRNKSIFKDAFVTFSERPQLQYMRGSLAERVYQLNHADWDMNTDLEAVFDLILAAATRGNVQPDEMPTHIIILSDMQFDEATDVDLTALEMIRSKYAAAEYQVPQVVFWNLRTSSGIPAKVNEAGVALLSGFSPSAMKAVLAGKALDPYQVMLDTLAPYDQVTL